MTLTLTKTRLIAGVWEGILTGGGDDAPDLDFQHLGESLDGPDLVAQDDGWLVRAAIPPDRIADGAQTFIILDRASDTVLASFTLLAGEALAEDIRADMALMRAELDMLKRAFRRHCAETIRD